MSDHCGHPAHTHLHTKSNANIVEIITTRQHQILKSESQTQSHAKSSENKHLTWMSQNHNKTIYYFPTSMNPLKHVFQNNFSLFKPKPYASFRNCYAHSKWPFNTKLSPKLGLLCFSNIEATMTATQKA